MLNNQSCEKSDMNNELVFMSKPRALNINDDFNINVLILDPIGSAWQGDENDKKEVSKLTSRFDSLISRKNISIVIVHHWRKPTRDSKTGGEMASGSYKWAAWVDIHITLN